MIGETDLTTLLADLRPELRDGRYVFVTADALVDAVAQASVVEPEGLSLVVCQEDADRLGLRYDFVARWIMLTVHSSLSAVGLTAAVSAALAEVGISCNVIAGRHHDHLLVPAARADDALATLARLTGSGLSR